MIQQNSALDSYRWSLREYLPKVGLNSSQNESIVTHSPDTRSLQVGVTLTQLLFDAGRGGRQKDLAKVQLAAGRQDYRTQEEQVTDAVRSLFNQILVLKKKLEIQETVAELAERQLSISRTEWSLGSAREIDVLDTEAPGVFASGEQKTDSEESEGYAVSTGQPSGAGSFGTPRRRRIF